MYHLDVIKSLNRNYRGVSESEKTRHCSFVRSASGTVLHSAKHRNTVHLKPGKQSEKFYIAASWLEQAELDVLIESYFN